MSHTPGPWTADIRTGCFAVYPSSESHNCMSGLSEIAIVYQDGRGAESAPGHYRYVTGEQIANARLIAAAPELLAALEEIEQRCDPTNFSRPDAGVLQWAVGNIARAAIARAKGEQA